MLFLVIPFSIYSATTSSCNLISAGFTHTCSILDDQSIKCWGNNDNGQLGLGYFSYNVGKEIGSMGDGLNKIDFDGDNTTKLVSVATSDSSNGYTCAISNYGSLKCWGYGGEGNLGNINETVGKGYYEDGVLISDMGEKLPEVDLGSDVYAIDVQIGYLHTCVNTYEKQLKCWGLMIMDNWD